MSCVNHKLPEKELTNEIDLTTELEIIGNNSIGWGYEISINNKKYIIQDFIPGVGGKKKFKTKFQATQVGNLVISKIKSQSGFPTVFIEELDSLKIDY